LGTKVPGRLRGLAARSGGEITEITTYKQATSGCLLQYYAPVLQNIIRMLRIEDAVFGLGSITAVAGNQANQVVSAVL
jgi:hypothetical protein